MTVSKSILTVSTVAFAMMFGGGVYVITQLNKLAKPYAERIASEAMGVNVTIGSLDVFLKERRAMASDIRIANPSGFIKPYAITIKNADVTLTSVAPKFVDFTEIEASGVDIYAEVQNKTTNIHELRKLVKAKQVLRDAEKAKTANDTAEDKPLNVIVRRIAMTSGQLHPSVVLFSNADLKPAPLKLVIVRDVGLNEGGIPAREATAQISKAVLSSLTNQAMDRGFYEGLSAEALQEIGLSQVDQMTKDIKKDINKIGDGLKSLFGE